MNQLKKSNHLYKLQQTAKISKCIMNNYIYIVNNQNIISFLLSGCF